VELSDSDYILPFAVFTRGLAAYRQSDFEAAIEWCGSQRIQRGKVWFRDVQADLVLAMAHQRLLHPAEASHALEAAQRRLNARKFEPTDRGSWHDWLICRALEREAVALINSAPPPGGNPAPRKAKSSGNAEAEAPKGQQDKRQ
jgi:hypothetical protein